MTRAKQAPAVEPYEIQRTLVLSTGHVTYKDSCLLEDAGVLPQLTDSVLYGWRIYCGCDCDGEWREAGASDALVSLFVLARSLECSYLLLDQDGEERDELPRFDWEPEALAVTFKSSGTGVSTRLVVVDREVGR